MGTKTACCLSLVGLALALPRISECDENNALLTGHFANGNYWKIMREDVKAGYVMGLRDGPLLAFLSVDVIDQEKSQNATAKSIKAAVDPYWSIRYSTKEMVEALDDFYKDPANAQIRIVWAFDYCINQFNNVSRAGLERTLPLLRQQAIKYQQ